MGSGEIPNELVIWAVSLSTTDLITRSLTPVYGYLEFVVYLDSVTHDLIKNGAKIKRFSETFFLSMLDDWARTC